MAGLHSSLDEVLLIYRIKRAAHGCSARNACTDVVKRFALDSIVYIRVALELKRLSNKV